MIAKPGILTKPLTMSDSFLSILQIPKLIDPFSLETVILAQHSADFGS